MTYKRIAQKKNISITDPVRKNGGDLMCSRTVSSSSASGYAVLHEYHIEYILCYLIKFNVWLHNQHLYFFPIFVYTFIVARNLIIRVVRLAFMVLRHFQQYLSYIVAVNVIGGWNWSTWRKPPTCLKPQRNFIA